jgi:hypothetical protein
MSNDINYINIVNVNNEITLKKNINNPYFATIKNVKQVETDYDEFPYKRWYRGIPELETPVVIEREAGFRKQTYNKYIYKPETTKINHCFEGPCTTIYPCNTNYQKKYYDNEQMYVILNNKCLQSQR